ncbi:unnamed protein product [Cuscuta epithymum]|uniref:Uncharacterized protein n=1 Tax=Cuscuta epithymum TaxID=186058 RepID=A0AAV0BZ61_9ASTE|nr:unnamed protein product [Cuscuta epithymum]CAH9123347.1 unnamed protein product [Cuscuta epithymum]
MATYNNIPVILSYVTTTTFMLIFLLSVPNAIASEDENTTLNTQSLLHQLEPHQLDSDNDIDPTKLTFKLSFTWPKGYCKTKGSGCERATNLPDRFTIHGLWPIYRAKCTDSTEKFSVDLLKDLRGRLDRDWPDLKNYGNPSKYGSFWEHEWDKHGKKCALYTVRGYFRRSLNLYDASNVLQLLQKAGNPTNVDGVKKAFPGRTPNVFCKNGSDGKYYFFQLEFCLNSTELFENCPEKPEKTHCTPGKEFSYGA